jgi:hypothetical protein
MSQNAAAKALGIAQSTLHQLERTATGSAHTSQLAALYGVNAVWLATGEAGGSVQSVGLPEDEVALLSLYRKIRDPQRRLDLISRANRMATEGDGERSKANPFGGIKPPGDEIPSEPMPLAPTKKRRGA